VNTGETEELMSRQEGTEEVTKPRQDRKNTKDTDHDRVSE